MHFLDIMDQVYMWLSSPPSWFMMLIPFAWDLVRRVFPTAKPASFFHDLGNILSKVGRVMTKLGEFLDNIAPQNLKRVEGQTE